MAWGDPSCSAVRILITKEIESLSHGAIHLISHTLFEDMFGALCMAYPHGSFPSLMLHDNKDMVGERETDSKNVSSLFEASAWRVMLRLQRG